MSDKVSEELLALRAAAEGMEKALDEILNPTGAQVFGNYVSCQNGRTALAAYKRVKGC